MKKFLFLLLSLFITNKTLCSETEKWTIGGQQIPSPAKFEQYQMNRISPTQNDTRTQYSIGNSIFRRNSAESAAAAAIFNTKK